MKNNTLFSNPLDRDFIRLLTDFGFKRVFGSKERSGILKRFLNALFEGEKHITKVEYRDKELLPEHERGKKILFDIYCTTDKGDNFIIEMQQEESENFSDRMLFYVCRAIASQGVRGLEYVLDPVYCIVLANFNMSGMSVSLIKDMVIMERVSHEVYTENLRMIFLSLPEVPEEWDECETELLRLLYLIKNMEDLTKASKPYLSGEYEDIFTASSTGMLSNEEAVAYSQSYYKDIDNQSAVQFAAKRNREEGRLEGAMEMLREMVRNLRSNGFDNDAIAKFLGKSPEIISEL